MREFTHYFMSVNRNKKLERIRPSETEKPNRKRNKTIGK